MHKTRLPKMRGSMEGLPLHDDWLYSPAEACIIRGCGHSKLYEEIAAGLYDVRKDGRLTKLTGHSIRLRMESLPSV
jgi:hypothetical protein